MIHDRTGQPSDHFSLQPPLLVFSDDAGGGRAAGAAAEAAGGRICATLPLADAPARLADQVVLEAVVLDIAGDGGAVLDEALDAVCQSVATRGHPAVIAIQPELIDIVAARAWQDQITLLCRPGAFEYAGAVSMALAERRFLLRDVNSDHAPVRLRELSEEVGRIARTLAALSDGNRPRSARSRPRSANRHAVSRIGRPRSRKAIRRPCGRSAAAADCATSSSMAGCSPIRRGTFSSI